MHILASCFSTLSGGCPVLHKTFNLNQSESLKKMRNIIGFKIPKPNPGLMQSCADESDVDLTGHVLSVQLTD